MKKNIELSDTQKKEFLRDLYHSFATGYDFESFLKLYLEKLGLDEVFVTQKSRDGGMDLTAKRNGIGEFSDTDAQSYLIQAKRFKPGTSVGVTHIRELKGLNYPSSYKRMFITTGRFTFDAQREAESINGSIPVLLIDGEKLAESCIDNEIGVIFTPRFSKSSLKEFLGMGNPNPVNNQILQAPASDNTIKKQITKNDIRARILRFPKAMGDSFPTEKSTVEIIFNGAPATLSIDGTRTYLAGVTQLYKDAGLIAADGTFNPCKAKWGKNDDGSIFVNTVADDQD